MKAIRFTIPTEPRSKKNSQQIAVNRSTGARFVVQSEAYKRFEKECKNHIPKTETINAPVNVRYVFYKGTHRRCDLTNLCEAMDDILVKYKVLLDDNYTILESHDGSRVYVDKDNPRIEVEISFKEGETDEEHN